MGDSNATPGRRASHEEVFSDEDADEAQSSGEAEPPGGRNSPGTCGTNVHGRGPMNDFDRINAR
jgi:hypothetical protein